MRAEPPENLQRVPGPEAILYFLHRDPTLKAAGVRLPRSQTCAGYLGYLFQKSANIGSPFFS